MRAAQPHRVLCSERGRARTRAWRRARASAGAEGWEEVRCAFVTCGAGAGAAQRCCFPACAGGAHAQAGPSGSAPRSASGGNARVARELLTGVVPVIISSAWDTFVLPLFFYMLAQVTRRAPRTPAPLHGSTALHSCQALAAPAHEAAGPVTA